MKKSKMAVVILEKYTFSHIFAGRHEISMNNMSFYVFMPEKAISAVDLTRKCKEDKKNVS